MTTTTVRPVPSLLRLALRLDAVVTAANGAAYLLAAPLLGDLLGLPAGWLRGVGVFLLLFGASSGRSPPGPRRPARAARPAPPGPRRPPSAPSWRPTCCGPSAASSSRR